LDLDVGENVGPGGLTGLPHGRPDLRFQDGEPAFRGGIIVLIRSGLGSGTTASDLDVVIGFARVVARAGGGRAMGHRAVCSG
ncbi:hypothetical protein AAH978_19025, partial [Streptomyces sp. ZYX-F-203]